MKHIIPICLLIVLSGALCAEPLFTGNEATPKDAVVLFDGKDLSNWVKWGTDQPSGWKVENGYVEIVNGTGDLASKQSFGDLQLHAEFRLPLMANAHGQARANGGIFLWGHTYEIQVLDSYGLQPTVGDCGAVFSLVAPLVNASRPPETWQTYDIVFHAPKFDAAGKKTANARVTVLLNGVLIQDDTEIVSPTHSHTAPEPTAPGPIVFQDHHSVIRYRNIWVRPL